ncbi:MAG: DUF4912 domain-containing protein [Spirochaetes bacterium]|jgi:hypothetical protein|nr:DUF4912 domain-containing protein [Spirochaetota bacterium]
MIRDRLEALSVESLRRIAVQYDIDFTEDTSRETLAELIFDAIEENRLEKEASDTNPVRVEEKKYVLLEGAADLEGVHDFPDDAQLPEHYNETRIVLLVRDPAWAFAYWEIAQGTFDELGEEDDASPDLLLRVSGSGAPSLEHADQFDIPVQNSDGDWYINLPRPETYYRIDLIARDGDIETLLASSNTILVPPGALPEERDDRVSAADHVLAYSGLDKLDVASFGATIPQRILGLMDENF